MATAARREIAAGELVSHEMQPVEMSKNEVNSMNWPFYVVPMTD
jgi:hypothetical protein